MKTLTELCVPDNKCFHHDEYCECFNDAVDKEIENLQSNKKEWAESLGMLGTIKMGALRSIRENKKDYVFMCCGNTGKPIEDRGLCPHCKAENTEVITRWKYELYQSIINLIIKGI
jgi:rubrerythrin